MQITISINSVVVTFYDAYLDVLDSKTYYDIHEASCFIIALGDSFRYMTGYNKGEAIILKNRKHSYTAFSPITTITNIISRPESQYPTAVNQLTSEVDNANI